MQIGSLIEKMLERYSDLPYSKDIKIKEINKLKGKSALITQKSKIKSDMITILNRNVSNNHMMNHVRGAEDKDETHGLEGLPEEWVRKIEKKRTKQGEEENDK
jgi:hypothetical protein